MAFLQEAHTSAFMNECSWTGSGITIYAAKEEQLMCKLPKDCLTAHDSANDSQTSPESHAFLKKLANRSSAFVFLTRSLSSALKQRMFSIGI